MVRQITARSTVDGVITAEQLATDDKNTLESKKHTRSPRHRDIADRLQKQFGLGDKAQLRRIFYERCQLAVDRFGDAAYSQIVQAAIDAKKATCPARFFCAAVKARLELRGLSVWEEII